MKNRNKLFRLFLCVVFTLFVFSNIFCVNASQNKTSEILNICDINGDGNTNNRDLAVLMQYINAWNVQIDSTTADFNNDGNVNNKDYCLLMRYLNGWGSNDNTGDYNSGVELPTDEW